jgi:hypothetical protein
MKRIVVVVAAALAGCQSVEPPEPAAKGKPRAPADTGGRFFARGAAGDAHELKLHKLAVDVSTSPGTVHSHLTMEVATAAEGQSEAMIRMPVPRGAAVTDAVLWVNDKRCAARSSNASARGTSTRRSSRAAAIPRW